MTNANPEPFRLMLVDDHELMRVALRVHIETHIDDVQIVAEAQDGNQLFSLLQEQDCELVVLDLDMKPMNGVQAFSRLQNEHPTIQCLIYTGAPNEEVLEVFKNVYQQGIDGFLLKRGQPKELIRAIESIREGWRFFSNDLFRVMLEEHDREEVEESIALFAPFGALSEGELDLFTPRQRDIVQAVEQGLSNAQIASRFRISIHTVRKHRQNINRILRQARNTKR